MSRSKTSRAWMRRHVTDAYVRQARAEGYRSRAAYKLLQLDERDRLLRPGMTVVDLGAAPGGWSQVAAARVGPAGRVIALDLLAMAPLAGVTVLRGDLRDAAVAVALERELGGARADLVMSDMAPNLSGIGLLDQARSAELAQTALEFARRWLKPGGALLVKGFQGEEFARLRQAMAACFDSVAVRKPGASRGESSEIYVVARGFRGRSAGGSGTEQVLPGPDQCLE